MVVLSLMLVGMKKSDAICNRPSFHNARAKQKQKYKTQHIINDIGNENSQPLFKGNREKRQISNHYSAFFFCSIILSSGKTGRVHIVRQGKMFFIPFKFNLSFLSPYLFDFWDIIFIQVLTSHWAWSGISLGCRKQETVSNANLCTNPYETKLSSWLISSHSVLLCNRTKGQI